MKKHLSIVRSCRDVGATGDRDAHLALQKAITELDNSYWIGMIEIGDRYEALEITAEEMGKQADALLKRVLEAGRFLKNAARRF